MQKKQILILLVIFSLVFSIGMSSVYGAQTGVTVQKYVALGDSLTYGQEPSTEESAQRYGFVERLHEQMLYRGRAEVYNYAIPELTAIGLKNFIEVVKEEKPVAAADIQPLLVNENADLMLADPSIIKEAIASADVITITIGGNDLLAAAVSLQTASDEEIQKMSEQLYQQYSENVSYILQTLLELNPKAKVIIADQYQPVPALLKDIHDKLNTVTSQLTSILDQLAADLQEQQYNVQVAHVAKRFVGKEISLTYIISKKDSHPTQAGYLEMAKAFALAIWGDYKEPIAGSADGINPIIVGGKEVNSEHKPLLLNGTTYVPIREYTEALGAIVNWEAATRSATISIGQLSVKLTIDSDEVIVGGQSKKITTIPRMHNNKIYVPLRLMAEALGFDVKYIAKSRMIYINQ